MEAGGSETAEDGQHKCGVPEPCGTGTTMGWEESGDGWGQRWGLGGGWGENEDGYGDKDKDGDEVGTEIQVRMGIR